jgi:hypothetical protein
VGGMLFSTFLTLVIVPVVYTLLARFTKIKEKVRKEELISDEELENKFEPVPAEK